MKPALRVLWIVLLAYCVLASVAMLAGTCTEFGDFATGKLSRVAQARTAALAGLLLVASSALIGRQLKPLRGKDDLARRSERPAGSWGAFFRGPGL